MMPKCKSRGTQWLTVLARWKIQAQRTYVHVVCVMRHSVLSSCLLVTNIFTVAWSPMHLISLLRELMFGLMYVVSVQKHSWNPVLLPRICKHTWETICTNVKFVTNSLLDAAVSRNICLAILASVHTCVISVISSLFSPAIWRHTCELTRVKNHRNAKCVTNSSLNLAISKRTCCVTPVNARMNASCVTGDSHEAAISSDTCWFIPAKNRTNATYATSSLHDATTSRRTCRSTLARWCSLVAYVNGNSVSVQASTNTCLFTPMKNDTNVTFVQRHLGSRTISPDTRIRTHAHVANCTLVTYVMSNLVHVANLRCMCLLILVKHHTVVNVIYWM